MRPLAHASLSPSPWVVRWGAHLDAGSHVLDLAAGGGRHTLFLLDRGHRVTSVDKDASPLRFLAGRSGLVVMEHDLEAGPWPYGPDTFDAAVVTNYLHRPLFGPLLASIRRGGCLIYETFAVGNERYGRPSNPDFLLRENELLGYVMGWGTVLAFEHLYTEEPKPSVVQRVFARRADAEKG